MMMQNVIAVLLACAGVFLALTPLGVSLACAISGSLLSVLSVLLLLDLPGGDQ